MNHENEVVCSALLAIAGRDLREGRIIHACTMFGSLAEEDFSYKGQAQLGEAIAQVRMPHTSVLKDASTKLERIVSQFDKTTVFRAHALRHLGEVKIGLRNFDEATKILDAAHDIYKGNGVMRELGLTLRLQGVLYVKNKQFKDALVNKFSWTKPISEFEFEIPDVLPLGFGTEDTYSDRADETPLVAFAGLSV